MNDRKNLAIGIGLALACWFALMGCAFFTKAAPAIAPTVTLAECITSEAIQGKPFATIVTDCKTDLLTVLDTLISSEVPGVAKSRAATEGHEMVIGVVRAYRSSQAPAL